MSLPRLSINFFVNNTFRPPTLRSPRPDSPLNGRCQLSIIFPADFHRCFLFSQILPLTLWLGLAGPSAEKLFMREFTGVAVGVGLEPIPSHCREQTSMESEFLLVDQ